MTVSTVRIPLQKDLLHQIDQIILRESRSRIDLILEATEMHVNRKRNWQEIFSYGDSIAAQGNFSENDVLNEIKAHRKK